MEKQQTKSNLQRIDKKRRLNIVYFVDSSRTRSLSMSINQLTALLILAGGIVTWAMIGTGFVYYLAKENIKHRANYEAALLAIFEYQSRYDGVYERAYPDGRQLHPIAKTIETGKNSVAVDDSALGDADFSVGSGDQTKTPPTKLITAKTEKAVNTPQAPVVNNKPDIPPQIPGQWMISLEKPAVEKTAPGFDLNFALRNRQKEIKADGYVWAVATVLKDSGETVRFTAPMNLELDQQGNVVDGRRAHKFSIKHYKAKKFNFQTPQGVSGVLTSIDIGLMNQDGTSKMFKVPLKFKVDLPVPQPAGTEPPPAVKIEGDVDEPDEEGA